MVKILKTMLPKHKETLSPWIQEFVEAASTALLPLLPQQLAKFPSRWPFPRGDLYHWIPLLNRFDYALEAFCTIYGLRDGPQTRDFTCELLLRDWQGSESLEALGYREDGDLELVECILNFSRMLLENCGNRSIYASSPHLSDLLNSTSLSLLASTLQIGSQLAQRYQASYKRMAVPHRHANAALLANHYNIDLDRVQHLAQPFVRNAVFPEPAAPATPATPNLKGKEKSNFNNPPSNKAPVSTLYANDLVTMVRGCSVSNGSLNGGENTTAHLPAFEAGWDEWGDVRLTYYAVQAHPEQEALPNTSGSANTLPSAPVTPTPIRRSSTLGHQHSQRTSKLSSTDDPSSPTARITAPSTDEALASSLKVVEIPRSKVKSTPIHQLLKEAIPTLPQDSKYELLTKLRVAHALTTSIETRRQMLAVRILAITNLAYIHTESTFLEKVLKQDSDEPRRLQLIYQLADLIHPPADGQVGIPRRLQTIALSGLEALAQHQAKFQDICTALNTNVSHGVLLYIVRKAVAEMATDEPGENFTEKDEWRGALFQLLSHVATLPRAGSEMVTAGLVPILVEVLTLRTGIAERNYPKILQFLDTIIFNVRDAFQILVNADGLEAIQDLIVHEVKTASRSANVFEGMPPAYRSPSIDYQIPYFQQQSIKWLFKFIHHMMTTAGGYGGNFDRLLRNLIDSTPLLGSLRDIIGHAHCFGSTVWTNAVSILNDFINNEPTSFAVIAEAGLSRELLESVTGKEIKMPEEPKDTQMRTEPGNDASSPAHTDDDSIISAIIADDDIPHPPTAEILELPREGQLAQGIMPSAEAISIIPQAFGAICLNTAGMRMFQSSNALESFFEIFESPKHVQCMESDLNLATNLGSSFDELVRHHPPLKTAIMNATLDMVARVAHLCKKKSSTDKIGARLWATDANGKVVAADDSLHSLASSSSQKGKGKANGSDIDVEMSEVTNNTMLSGGLQSVPESIQSGSMTPFVYAVATFLSTMFSNTAVRVAFMEKGGIEYVLDLAELPSLPYDFADDRASQTLHTVISLLAEQKPHLVLPSLVKRAQAAVDTLSPFAQSSQHKEMKAYFAPFVSDDPIDFADSEGVKELANGTKFAKAFVNVLSLTTALHHCFQTPVYNHRTSGPTFNQMNLADYYIKLVRSLGPILAGATREDFILQKGGLVPAHWKRATRARDIVFSSDAAVDDIISLEPREPAIDGSTAAAGEQVTAPIPLTNEIVDRPSSSPTENQAVTKRERDSSRFQNFQTLRYLLNKVPPTISLFFQSLGKALISKRNLEAFQRQSHVSIADALAETVLLQLVPFFNESTTENYTYWIVMLGTVKDLLINVSRHSTDRPFECSTLILQAFKERNGFDALNHMLEVFTEESRHYDPHSRSEAEPSRLNESLKRELKVNLAALGTKHILTLYLMLVAGKSIVEANQTAAMVSRPERDRMRPEFFSTGQFLVEIRMAVLPTIRRLWDSDLVEKATHQIPNRLIDIIRTIALADYEQGAFKRSDKMVVPAKSTAKSWKPSPENLSKLIEAGFSEDLAKEALFRCNNTYSSAVDYCKAQIAGRSGGRNPIPQNDLDTSPAANGSSRGHTGPSTGTATPVNSDLQPMQLDEPLVDVSNANSSNTEMQPTAFQTDPMDMSLDNFIESDSGTLENAATSAAIATGRGDTTPPSPSQRSIMTTTDSQIKAITVDDLNDERAAVRGNLVDRCLDVINAHGEVTFEICDLIKTVVDKSDDQASMRKEMGETLVKALMSFAAEEDVRIVGKKVAAYAHLLALMLQDKSFYNASIGELKENLQTLLAFVKLSPTHSSEESSPWIAHILLIIETLLCEDAQPYETEWKPPANENSAIEKPVLKLTEPAVSGEDRIMLCNLILEILPRIGKDDSLALAVLRVLVILTRSRNIAQAMGEKKNIQRLFVMAKQLAGATSARLQSPLMLILRHIIEDDETIKQVMRSEIKAFFARAQRHIDVASYIRQLSHLVIRAPELFVEVTSEMVKLSKWSISTAESQGRQQITLQDQYRNSSRRDADGVMLPNIQSTAPLSILDVKPSTETSNDDSLEKVKPVQAENKTPVVGNPDGVIHFLLCELLNYKDVEDKDPGFPPLEKSTAGSSIGPVDAAMVDVGSPAPTDSSTTVGTRDSKKQMKQEFKAEEHPIYIYRCFILQCLTELLSCYNRTKIEFINFKRSAPPQAMTPAKPRSSVVNYLLFDLIPVGTLDHAETIALRKKLTTSSWADSVLTALLSKTGEQIMDRERDATDAEDEPDLFFVRKFVLENILKAYKDASSSTEPLDIKYARMLSLADLMNHIMAGKDNHAGASDPTVATRSGLQLRRIMFEKGYIAALTGSIADLDLNFPGAKRAVKHILRPLKVLTQTAIELSDSGKVSLAPGQIDEEEIASASSASEIDDEREETPDLFRNSTLGMFEPGRDNDLSSDSDDDDEEMYEGEYDDEEMEYEEEMAEDEDNISDEDEELGGIGEIEGMPGDHGVDVEVILGDDDEDDEDDDEDPSDEDDEGESEDIDDDEHIEIIDEDGNSHPLGEGDDEDEWQSEDDEEEDYEGRAADEEEVERGQGIEHIARGAIGHLVRALGGDGPSGAVEILQRIEDETMDADAQRELENYLEDGQDDEEDDEDEEDMDDEGLYDDYPVASPGMAFEWNGATVEPSLPMIISHRAHRARHGIPSPFPFFPGGPRDPLGGMLDSLTTLVPPSQLQILNEISEVSDRLARAQERVQELRGNMGIGGLQSDNTNQHSVPDYRNSYRSHRPGLTPRGDDDGRNPLLQRFLGSSLARDGSARSGPTGGPLASLRQEDGVLDIGLGGRGPFGESPVALLNDLINSLPLPGSIARHGHAFHFHVTGGARNEMPRDLQAMFGMRGLTRFETRREVTTEPGNATFFTPQSTSKRWIDEAKLLFSTTHPEKSYQRVLTAVMAVLIPPALKAEVEARKIAEEQKKKREEERIAKEKKEAEERAAKEKKEAEDREAAEAAERVRVEEVAAASGDNENHAEAKESQSNAQEMEGIETSQENSIPTAVEEAAPVENRPRVLTTIRGNEVDITDLGIDADFLRELPEDIREEVITTAVAERRSLAAAAGAEPSEIDQEFLDALPAEIRDEIIQQERQDRRRREREEQRRQAALNGGPAPAAAAQEMDAASILATLPPDLRRQVLMEQGEEILAQLPPEYVAQARAGMRDLPLSHVRSMGIGRSRTVADLAGENPLQKPQRRSIVQMLDKAGVATLLRLMFVFQQDSLRNTLYQVLQNISENRYNRGEVISTLLHILQDGSADMTAVERSFAHLSLRAKQPKEKEQPKTPQPPKRSLTGVSLNVITNADVSPLMVVQQCLSALIYLCKVNPHIPSFFLTEHESSGGLKRSASRKGKGKDTRASKYALNSLLTLLDRKLIMESSSVMELLSDLLSRITGPLQALERKQKEADETKKILGASSNTDIAPSAASPEPANSTEQTSEPIEANVGAAGVIPTETTTSSAIEGDAVALAGEQSDKQTVTTSKDGEQKKLRPFVPPIIPEFNLKLVINIFVARECSAKTFRETLSTIKNLSCIPGAKAVFGRELIRRAQQLAEIIVTDLDELLPQILKASTGTEIQGVALAKFSPSGSDQSKLLRVLTALDHLFDPKNGIKKDDLEGTTAEAISEPSKETEKYDLLAALYENSTFGLMWDKLSACLGAIRQREHMLNVATILLPLIESLMVVCKNTTLKDTPAPRSQIARDIHLTSPPPDSRMENLFFTFTEEHRKILNELVRHTPKLMSGTFSLLVKNPKVLEFDNKRNYFTRSIHNRNSQTRQSYPPLQLSVRREQVFHDSFQSLCFKTGDEMKFGKLSIRFHGEEGVDAGGVTREWFQVLSRQMFDPGYALFIPVSSDRTTFHPNHMSGINPEHLMFFKFIGRVIGKALYEGRVLDCHFSRAVYKRILGKSVSVKDMESLDPDYYKSLVWMLENDITDIITETFSVDNDKFGIVETVDLIENGRNVLVTQENKQEYVRLMVEFKLTGSVQDQLDNFLKGFHEIIPAELVAIFNEQELELLISGLPEIDVDDWKSNTEYHNYTGASPQIQWFWRAVRSFDKEERAKLLQFVTGTSKVPLNGFKELEGMNGFSRFNIHRDYGNKDRLPSSHTCFNQLDLPEYEGYEILRQQILTAITAGSEYFGFA